MAELTKQALIVDHSPAARKMIKSILQNNGWHGNEAEDSTDAINMYKLISPKIVIIEMDMGLGNEDGLSIARKIMQIDKNAKIIMVSASMRRENVIRSTEAGAKGYLLKPIDPTRLINTVENI